MCNTALDNLFIAFHNTTSPVAKKHIRYAIKRTIAEILGEEKQPKLTLSAHEIDLARHNGKIAAIKAVRERLNIGLREAKDLVENEMEQKGYRFSLTDCVYH